MTDTLQMADRISGGNYNHEDVCAAAAKLRRLHTLNAQLLAAVKRVKETGVFVGAIAHGMIDDAIAAAEEEER